MSYPEDKNPLTGKAPEHQLNALKALSEMGKTVIAPASKKYNIHIRTVTETNPAEVIYKGIAGSKTKGWVILFNTTGKNKDLFYSILEDIKKIPGRMYNGKDKYWYIPETSKEQLEAFIAKYSLETPEIPVESKEKDDFKKWDIVEVHWVESGANYAAEGTIVDTYDEGYKIRLNENASPLYSEGNHISINKKGFKGYAVTNYITHKKPDIPNLVKKEELKPGDIVTAHWIIKGVHYSTEVRVIAIYDVNIRVETTSALKLDDWKKESKPAGTKFDFDYPFDKEHYLTRKELTIEDITEVNVVNALKDLGYDNDKLSKRIAPNYIETTNQVIENKVKSGLSNPSESSYASISKHVWDLQAKIIGDIVKISVNPDDVPFKVGEIAEAHWIHEGVDCHTDVEIRQIFSDRINFVNLKKIDLWGDINPQLTWFGFDYPFTKDRFIEKYVNPPKASTPDFKVGDIVIATWGDDIDNTFHVSGDAVITKSDKNYWHVKLLQEVTDGANKWPEGKVILYDKSKEFTYHKNLKHKYAVTKDDDDDVVFEATPEQKKFLSDLTANVMKRILAPKETKTQFEKVFETESRTEQLKKLKNMGKSLEDQVKEIEQEYIEEAKTRGDKKVYINDIAKMIREILKLYFPKTKFSVRTSKYSGGHSIDVSWDFGPTDKQVYSLVNKYHDKGFDPMTDSTSYLDTPWNNDSVSTQRNIPDDYILRRGAEIAKEHGVIIENITFPIYNNTKIGDEYLSDLVGKELKDKEI